MQFPERFRGQFLRPADIAYYPVNETRQRSVVLEKELVEIVRAFAFPGHRNVRTERHIVLTTPKDGI